MKATKITYLFLALLLPGLIYVFLRKFGKNEFDLPVYHQAEIDAPGCSYTYAAPYRVPDSLWNSIEKKLTLVAIQPNASTQKNFERLSEELESSSYRLVILDSVTQKDAIRCAVLLRRPWTTVLVDSLNQIRGYYEPSTREEFDRLKMEMDILLKRY